MAGIFKGLGAAKARLDANYERAGHYYMRIDKCKTGETRKKEEFFAIEKTVVHVLDDAEGKGHRVGEGATHMMMAKHDSFLGNVKSALAGILGMNPADVDEETAMQVCDEDQPLAMTVVECKNRNIVLKKSGGDFTSITYVREVPPAELLEILSAEHKKAFFPNNFLENVVAQLEANAAANA